MSFPTPLVGVPWLLANLSNPNLRIVDCRYSLTDPLTGRMGYREGHLPGAIFFDLETDLSAPVLPDRTGGRHPLPTPAAFAATLGEAGIDNASWVVAYDEIGMTAPRLWWLMRWLGHEKVAVLDGGIKAWVAAGGALETLAIEYAPVVFIPNPKPEMVLTAEEVLKRPAGSTLIDSRAPERYRGEVEPIDPVAGHIPGAINRNWADGVEGGHFKSTEAQQQRFAGLGDELILYCGSGVSAAANALALELAGHKGAKLYAGSWSDWVSDPNRPVAKGEE
jgi:thiosulfate/3-mercaptopyruvate sulfurtransferase